MLWQPPRPGFDLQPGVASVYCTIVQQTKEGVEFYLKKFPELDGKTFQQARRLFDDAVLCGYIRKAKDSSNELHINCKDSDVLQENDRVIALSQDGEPFLRLATPVHQIEYQGLGRLQYYVSPRPPSQGLCYRVQEFPAHTGCIWSLYRTAVLYLPISGFKVLVPSRNAVQ